MPVSPGSFGRAGDQVLLPADHAAVVRLLKPRQAVAVRGERGDDVGLAVAIHIVAVHLRAAAAEHRLVKGPRRIALERFRLLPPAARFQDVHLAVAIDIAVADAVGEALVRRFAPAGMAGETACHFHG